MTVNELKKILREAVSDVIYEAEDDDSVDNAPDSEEVESDNQDDTTTQQQSTSDVGASVDAQIDRFLIGYEREAKNVKSEGVDHRMITYRFLSEDIDTQNDGQLDIESFAADVARLVENYDSLLEMRDTIVKRATNFLKKVYDPTVVEQFEQVMDDQFEIKVGESDIDKELDVDVPPAIGAGVPPGA
jgi:hypothetical protein